jgi:predicted phage-related endonuclease
MKTLKFKTEEAWLAARVGKITGSRLKDLINKRGTGNKKGFYELIAERVALPADGENPMDRGHRLEKEAIERFSKETGKKVDGSLIMWVSKEDDSIAISPDGIIGKTQAIEIKCLNSASHIEALLTGELPTEYYFQSLQYFIVNPKLKKLYFAFYDPRIPHKDFFYFTIDRKDREADAETYLREQLNIIASVEKIVLELTGF